MSKYTIVPTDPKTGKLIRSPKTYQPVRYALQGPRGGLKKIQDAPVQQFTKKDFIGINKTIAQSGSYVIYEQLTPRHMRDASGNKVQKVDGKGNLVFRTTKAGRKVPEYYQEKKITFFRKDFEQRPVLYKGAKRQREMDIGFKKLSPRQQADQQAAVFVKPDTGTRLTYTLTGESVRDALSNLVLDIDKREIYGPTGKKTAGLYYNIVTYITDPEGKTIRIPASGALATLQAFKDVFPDMMTKSYPGEQGLPAFRKEVRTLANINREMAWAVSNSITKVGYRFTSLKNLKGYAAQMNRNASKLEKEGKKLIASGQQKAGEKKLKGAKNIRESRATMIKDKSGKKMLRKGQYVVKIIVDFETVPVK